MYAADARHALFEATVAWKDSDRATSGVVNVLNRAGRPPWGVIVTQTCDLVEEGARPKRPWILIAPVYRLDVDRGTRNRILRERGFNYLVPISALGEEDGGLWVADLRLLVPVEKGWLVGAATGAAFTDEAGYDRLARQLTSQFARPAYATALISGLLKPLYSLLEEVTEAYDGQDSIVEVTLALGRSRIDPTTAQVIFLCDGPVDDGLRERILAWGRDVIENPPAGINVLMPRIAGLDEMTVREYRTLDSIDTSAFSPELDDEPPAEVASAAEYGEDASRDDR